jgi:hypothetical protein
MPRLAILTSLCLVLLATPALAFRHKETQGPATLEARSESEGQAMALADVLHLVVTLEGSKGLEVDGPLRLGDVSAWDVLAVSPPRLKTEEDGRVRWQQTLTLAPTAPGDQPLHLAPLTYRDGEGDRHTLRWTPFSVRIVTAVTNLDPRSARDISASEDPPPLPAATHVWPWIASVALAVVLAPGVVWLALRKRARPAPSSALHKAMRECDRVLAMQRANGKSRVILLTGVVRRFLERRFGMPARRQTTAELLAGIAARSDLPGDARHWLRTFFEQTDLIRYAGAAVTEDRCQELAQEIRQFCAGASSRS